MIEDLDFRRLTNETRAELIALLEGRPIEPRTPAGNTQLRWRRPIDLTADLARKLVHGLADEHVTRLAMFGNRKGRVAMADLLGATGDHDLRVLSHFEGVLTRKLRRLINDSEKKATLLGWDYDATKWSDDGSRIVDGVYYVTEMTAAALAEVLGRPRRR
ncbi:MAG: hypothetical protein ACREER_07745 [Alphaproteobacteria bacterium]